MSKYLTIDDICNITTGKLDSNAFDENGSFPFFTCAENPIKIDNYAFDDDVVLVAGNNANGNFHVNRYKGKFNAYQRTYILTSKSTHSTDFIYYTLKLALKLLKDKSQGSQTKFLTIGILKNIKLPEIKNYNLIAKVLSDLDAKIELNHKINAELEAMAKTLYDYWFVQFDFPDANGKPYKSSGGKMVWNEALKREIPEGWENTSIGEITDIFDSMRVPLSKQEREKMKGEIPYYGATGIMDYVNNYIFDGDYILLAEDGSVMDEKGFPIVQYIWGKTWVNNHAHVIKSKSDVLEYLFQLLKTIPVVNILTGSIQLKINQDNLKNYRIIKPNDEIVIKYNILTSKYRKKIINNVEENQHLASLRDWLLPMLMNGQVTVGDALRQAQGDELGMVAEPNEEYLKSK